MCGLQYKSIDLEKKADEITAVYATKHSAAMRKDKNNKEVLEVLLPEREETYRTNYRRDRDRILYSKGFRRLQYKTQVFTSSSSDHYRNRAMHTLEVQQLSLSLADAFNVNRDLAEAIAIGHDLGHTPFGHAVERELNDFLRDDGGFIHSIQSVKYVEHIEKYNNMHGLGLTKQVREGILKHDSDVYTRYNKKQWDCAHLDVNDAPNFEAQIVFWADKIAYLSHDWDDFVNSGLRKKIEGAKFKKDKFEELNNSMKVLMNMEGEFNIDNYMLRNLIRNLHSELVKGTIANIEKYNPATSKDVIDITNNNNKVSKNDIKRNLFVNFNTKYLEAFLKARECLTEVYLKSPNISKMDEKSAFLVRAIIDRYMHNDSNNILPISAQQRIESAECKCSKKRVIVDYLSNMTDRFINELYRSLFSPENGYLDFYNESENYS